MSNEEQRLLQAIDGSSQAPPFRFTGDGLGVLAGLLTSGLVEISRRFSGIAYFGGGMPSFEVSLTPAGRRLVEAWRTGKPDAVRAALNQDDWTA